MQIQNNNTDPKNEPKSFLDNKWIRFFSYALASLFIVAMLASIISRREFPTIGEVIILVVAIGYLYTDIKIRKVRS